MTHTIQFSPTGAKHYHAGLAIPVFSLRSEADFGVGQFSDLKQLADFTKASGLDLIQLLPINDTTTTKTWRDSSPYTAISVFALHPLYLNLEPLLPLLSKKEQKEYAKQKAALNSREAVDYDQVIVAKLQYAKAAYDKVKKELKDDKDFKAFCKERQNWLPAYAAFNYYQEKYETVDFEEWEEASHYSEKLLKHLSKDKEAKEFLNFQYYLQYLLHQQLLEAVDYAHQQGIAIKGDIAIGVGEHSVDTWQNPDLFNMDMQAGAPPDAFSVTGQNWTMPTYNWNKMAETDYAWWKARLQNMALYFDAYRLDHILGFFRIWEIPKTSIRGLLGHFAPARGFSVQEIETAGIPFTDWGGEERFVQPFIKDWVIDRIFGRDERDRIIQSYLTYIGHENYEIREEFQNQSTVAKMELPEEDKLGLYALTENVIFVKDHTQEGIYHPRISVRDTISFQEFGEEFQQRIAWLHDVYYFKRNNMFWKEQALEKLPHLIQATDMLACGEDLGMVPTSVPEVMDKLNILSLVVERMPANPADFINDVEQAPYLSVVSPSSHDTSTLREWWTEDEYFSQRYYNQILHFDGVAPDEATGEVIERIIKHHLTSPAMLAIFPLQDWLGMDESIRKEDYQSERINNPANPKNIWNYRLHLTLEELNQATDFIHHIKELVTSSRPQADA